RRFRTNALDNMRAIKPARIMNGKDSDVFSTAAPQHEPEAPAEGVGVPQPGPSAAGEREIPVADEGRHREAAARAAGSEHNPAREQKCARPSGAQVAAEGGEVRAAAQSPSAHLGLLGPGARGPGRAAEPGPAGARGAGGAAVRLGTQKCPGLAGVEPKWAGSRGAGAKLATGQPHSELAKPLALRR